MPAPTTTSPTLRRVLCGSAIGMGLLVSAGVVAPPALASPAPGFDGLLVPGAPGFLPLTPSIPSPAADSPSTQGAGSGAASSSEQAQPLTPDFGVGKNLDVHLTATAIPADLDLSGARFEVVDAAGKTQASCTTDAEGACGILLAQWMPPAPGMPPVTNVAPGSYRLRQDPAHAVAGLVPSTLATPFTVCNPFTFTSQCQLSVARDVADASLFRTALAVTVRDGTTHTPLAGASFSLTGADYRHLDPTVQQDQVTTFPQASGNQAPAIDSSVAVSDRAAATTSAADPTADSSASASAASDSAASSTPAVERAAQARALATAGSTASSSTPGSVVSRPDGVLTYRGWFLADGLTLTPEVIPAGYRSSGVLPVTPPVGSGDTWADTVDLAPEEGGVMGTGGSGPALPPVAPRAPIPSGAPTPPHATSAPVGQVPVVESQAAGTTSASAPTAAAIPASAAGRTPADPSGAPFPAAAPAAGGPQLRVAASMSLLDVGLIGFGVLFVALVVFGVGLMRRRARG